jgi:hypothetical protein
MSQRAGVHLSRVRRTAHTPADRHTGGAYLTISGIWTLGARCDSGVSEVIWPWKNSLHREPPTGLGAKAGRAGSRVAVLAGLEAADPLRWGGAGEDQPPTFLRRLMLPAPQGVPFHAKF